MNWLILRGFVREKRHWGPFPEIFETELKQIDPSAHVMMIDLPGFGDCIDLKSPMTVSGIVKNTRERWLKTRTNQGDWNILAISLGGMVSLQWSHDYPNDFQRAVVINSSMSRLSPFYKRVNPKYYGKIAKLIINPKPEVRERKILEMMTNLKGHQLEERAQLHIKYANEKNPKRRNALAQMIAVARFSPPKKINSKLLVLVSLGDQFVSPDCSHAIAKYYHAPILEHSHANHDFATDDPHWISEQVKNWVQKQI